MKTEPIKPRNTIKERAKHSPIEVRLFVHFQLEWYNMHIKTKRFHTLKEEKSAYRWAEKMTKQIMETYQKWEADGSPRHIEQSEVK